jgi:MYXO-CTERM domain-containing protein
VVLDDDDSVVLDDDDVVLDDDDDTPPTGDDDDTETPECGCNSAPGERHAGVFALLCLVALTVRRR